MNPVVLSKSVAQIGLVCLLASRAVAGIDVTPYKDQSLWKTTSFDSEGFTSHGGAVRTSDGSLRFWDAMSFNDAEAQILFPIANKNLIGQEQYVCYSWQQVKGGKHELIIDINPLATKRMLHIKDNGKTAPAGSAFANAVQLESVTASLRIGSQSYSADPVTNPHPSVRVDQDLERFNAEAQRDINDQLIRQKEQIAETGEAVLDLTKYPTLACDLLQTAAKIQFEVKYSHEYGMLQTIQVFTDDQISKVYDVLKKSGEPEGNMIGKLVLGAMRVGAGLAEGGFDLKELNLERGIRLFKAFFDLSIGNNATVHIKRLTENDLLEVEEQTRDLVVPSVNRKITTIRVEPAAFAAKAGRK